MIASVGSLIAGSGTVSTRTSRLPCHVSARMIAPFVQREGETLNQRRVDTHLLRRATHIRWVPIDGRATGRRRSSRLTAAGGWIARVGFVPVEDPILPDAPRWFRTALEVPFIDERVDVDGCPIHYLAWGERGRRGLVFVHGGGAHAHWWTHVAATFAGDFRVARRRPLRPRRQRPPRRVLRSSSGPTRSWRWPTPAASPGRPVVDRPQHGRVRHDRHRRPATPTALAGRDHLRLAGHRARPRDRRVPAQGGVRPAPHLRDASTRRWRRFRTVPPQEHYLDYVIDHVARQSLRAGRRRLAVEVRPPGLRPVRRGACARSPCPTCRR